MLEEPRAPLPLRACLGLLDFFHARCDKRRLYDPETFIALARKWNCELDARAFEALDVLCRSAREDAAFNYAGYRSFHGSVRGALKLRARLEHLRRHEPGLLRHPLRSPLLVIGLPRSGTTLLHRLLALADDARALKTWEVQQPLPPPGFDTRRLACLWQLRLLHLMAPQLAAKHPIGVDDAEEDFWLLNASLLSGTFFVFMPLHSYERWWQGQDMFAAYRAWAEILAVLQAATPQARLVLKAPVHTGFVDEVMAAVPNMQLVQIHRDPLQVVSSLNSLLHTFEALVSDTRDAAALGHRNLERLRQLAERNNAARARHPGIIDVQYDALVRDPVGTIAAVHERAGLAFTDAHRQRITAFLDGQRGERSAPHAHSLEECGLTAEAVRAALGPYTMPAQGSTRHA